MRNKNQEIKGKAIKIKEITGREVGQEKQYGRGLIQPGNVLYTLNAKHTSQWMSQRFFSPNRRELSP